MSLFSGISQVMVVLAIAAGLDLALMDGRYLVDVWHSLERSVDHLQLSAQRAFFRLV